ncbi:MAG TPA: RIP metalloprotease RseP [Burkholderiales bacterium]|nr:RIP metalloprotease RseP [Burkholderiales bacterium]
MLSTLLAFACTLGILVTIHEFGHYLAARWIGVKVLRFSVGFGKPLITRQWGRDNTAWIIAAIPLGGYVKMLDEREGPVAESETGRAFNRQTPAARIAIVAAGPLANLLLALLLYWGLFLHGIPAIKPILAEPAVATAAAYAGLHNGDEIRSIAGDPVHSWADINWALLRHTPSLLPLPVKLADGRTARLDMENIHIADDKSDLAEQAGLRVFEPPMAPRIGQILPDSIAARAGLQIGDEITSINGAPIRWWADFVQAVRTHPDSRLVLTVRRGGRLFNLGLVPAAVPEQRRTIGKIGAGPLIDESVFKNMLTELHYSFAGAFDEALVKTRETAGLDLSMMGRILTGSLSWHNLSGPLTIADYAGQSARSGWMTFIGFIATVSVSLGVLNLLPIPLLDGGHLMYYTVEIIRGAPLSERIMMLGQHVGLAMLLLLMAFAFYNDITRLFGS